MPALITKNNHVIIAKSIKEFNKWCESSTFNLDIHVNKLSGVSEDKLASTLDSILFNEAVKDLIPFIDEYLIPLKYEWEHQYENVNYAHHMNIDELEDTVKVLDKIRSDLDVNIELEEGDARAVFIFDDFVLKVDKYYDEDQTDREIVEYRDVLIKSEETGNKPYDLLPFIGYVNVDSVTFSVFPKAEVVFIDTAVDKFRDWLALQTEARFKLFNENVDLGRQSDLALSYNAGYYRGKLYIIDCGAIDDI